MHGYLDGRLRHPRSRCCFAHAQPIELDELNGLSRLRRELSHELHEIEAAVDRGGVIAGKYLCGLLDRPIPARCLGSAKIIYEPVSGDRIHPWSKELGAIVGVPTRVDGDQCL